jgi:oxygen-dependent protoporphyrinogen oxidase
VEFAGAGGEIRMKSPVREIIIGAPGSIPREDRRESSPAPVEDDGGARASSSQTVRGIIPRVTVRTDGGEESFDGAVAALPAPILSPILRGAPESLTGWLAGVRYRPAVSLVLLLDTPTSERYFGLSFPQGTTRYISAIAIQENKGIPLGDGSRGAMIAFSTPESAESLVGLESREILDRMLPEVAAAFPGIEKRVTRARVYRWPEAAPLMYPGYLAHLGGFRKNAVEGDAPFVLAGDYLYGPTVEGAVLSGFAAAERLGARMAAMCG